MRVWILAFQFVHALCTILNFEVPLPGPSIIRAGSAIALFLREFIQEHKLLAIRTFLPMLWVLWIQLSHLGQPILRALFADSSSLAFRFRFGGRRASLAFAFLVLAAAATLRGGVFSGWIHHCRGAGFSLSLLLAILTIAFAVPSRTFNVAVDTLQIWLQSRHRYSQPRCAQQKQLCRPKI